jgi:hypothetical protein
VVRSTVFFRAVGDPTLDIVPYLPGGSHIQAQGRFVQKDDLWIGDKAPDEIHLLAEAGRKVRDLGVSAVGQPHDLQQFFAPLIGRPVVEPVELGEHPQFLADTKKPVARRFAPGNHVDPPPDLGGLGVDVQAIHPDLAGGGR